MNTGVTNPLYGGLPEITIASFSPLGFVEATAEPRRSARRRQPRGKCLRTCTASTALSSALSIWTWFLTWTYIPPAQGTVVFTNLANFPRRASRIAGRFYLGNPQATNRSHWYSGFVQDDWRVNFQINLEPGSALRVSTRLRMEETTTLATSIPTSTRRRLQRCSSLARARRFPNPYNPGWGYFSPRLGTGLGRPRATGRPWSAPAGRL